MTINAIAQPLKRKISIHFLLLIVKDDCLNTMKDALVKPASMKQMSNMLVRLLMIIKIPWL